MAEEKPLTKSDLVAALKEIGVATNDTVHNQLTEFYDGLIKPEFEKIDAHFEAIDTRLNNLEERQASLEDSVNSLQVGQEHIRTEIKELNADLSDTPSRAEHENLKARVTALESRN
jgi:chromosome segregation ATPase